jgi:very-short-patch-repair endonuclease
MVRQPNAPSSPSPGGGGSAREARRGGVIPAANAAPAIDQFRRATARRLRKNETDAEQRLWKALRKLSLEGSHFRRQVPIGSYVADFACLSAKLIIEVDGSQHGEPEGLAKDAERTAWLRSQGFRVLRVWNNDVFSNLDGVLDAVYAELFGSLSAESHALIHKRHAHAASAVTPPRRAARADPPPPGEGEELP